MATRFELVLHGQDAVRLHAAGEEAIGEIEDLDRQLSRFRSESDISWINARAASEPVKVEPRLFDLLLRAKKLWKATEGAFDVTIAPLMRAWGLVDGTGRIPASAELEEARSLVGMNHVHPNEDDFTVRFDRPGVELDLGAIGKGYAIERAVESLRENGVTSGLIHGGTSTVYGLGSQPDGREWLIAVESGERRAETEDSVRAGSPIRPAKVIPASLMPRAVALRNSSLSVSAVHGKSFEREGREYGHVIDPRTGEPVSHTLLAAVVGESATDTDALSTALLVLGETWLQTLGKEFPGCEGFVVGRQEAP